MDIAARVGGQRHLAAVRDGLVSLMPLMILGSFVTLLGAIPDIINVMAGTSLALPGWFSKITGMVWWGTFDMIALLVVFSISYSLARYYDGDKLAAGLIAMATYLSIVPQTVVIALEDERTALAWGNVNRQYTNANGMFVGILVALLSTEIFVRLMRSERLQIRMPDSVPPAVGRSFSALLPGAVAVLSLTAFFSLLETFTGSNIFQLITRFLSAPLQGAADTLAWALIMVFLVHLFWFFGLHGTNILGGIIEPLFLAMMAANIDALVNGEPVPHIVTKTFVDAFVYMGGAGTVVGLMVAVLLVGRSEQYRALAKLAVVPSFFNINESVLFGMPIVLNPVLAVPFVAAPLAATVISYFAVALELVPRTITVIPWATPPIISGLLATGGAWQAVVLQLVNIAVSILIYLPFVRMADRVEQRKEQSAASESAARSAE